MAIGSYTFQTVNVPGAAGGTQLGGINNSGVISGSYTLAPPDFPYSQAFIDNAGTITTLDAPRSPAHGNGINSGGQVAGAAGDAQSGVSGFLWSPNAAAQQITPDDLRTHIRAFDVNDGGVVVGVVDWTMPGDGFIWQNGTTTPFQVPGAGVTEAHGINNGGTIVGTADNYGFIEMGGQFGLLNLGQVTDPMDINNGGTVVGSEFDGAHWHGWIDAGGTLAFIDAPGATDTWVTGINDAGTIVGYSSVDGGATQGFVATDPPAADPVTTAVREDYVGLFGRDADPGAQSFWTKLLKATPMTARDFVWALTTSAEGQWLHGGQTDAQFVNSVYVNALGRPADAGAQAVWSGVLHAGAIRGDVLAAIAGSPEGQQHFAATHS